MDADELQDRTKRFALRVMKLVNALPNTIAGREIGRQLLRAGTSVSANYRAARRGRSKREFVAKMGVVVEEADESVHWLELVMDGELIPRDRVSGLHDEATQLVRIFAKTKRTARQS